MTANFLFTLKCLRATLKIHPKVKFLAPKLTNCLAALDIGFLYLPISHR